MCFNCYYILAFPERKKLAELKKVFDEQAKKNNIYPFIDWADVFKGRTLKKGTDPKIIQQLKDRK